MGKNETKDEGATPDTSAVQAQLIALPSHVIDKLIDRLSAPVDRSVEYDALADLLKNLTAQARQSEKLTRATQRHSNASHENDSAFRVLPGCKFCDEGLRHPIEGVSEDEWKLGHPAERFLAWDIDGSKLMDESKKVQRERVVYYPPGFRLSEDQCSILEIQLINAIRKSKTARKGKWKATISEDGRTLMIDTPPYSFDERLNLPPFFQVLMELNSGPAAVNASNALERVAALEEQVQRLLDEKAQAHA